MIVASDLPEGGRMIELQRPERRNALDVDGLEKLRQAIDDAVGADVRALIVTGSGGHFCSGGDLQAIAAAGRDYAIKMGVLGQAVVRELAIAPLLTIAVIEGGCVGGGAELALACDIRLAVTSSYWMFPEVRSGAIPAWGGTQELPRHVGLSRAKQMLLSGRPLASELLAMGGLIAAVLPDRSSALAEATTYVTSAASASPAAFRAIKELVNRSGDLDSAAGADAELEADARLADEFAAHARESRG
jgi:enoyl-CoA hydratase/carnithine racemase